MTEPVLIKRNFLIASMVVLQTITPPLVAAGALFVVAPMWHIVLAPAALAVILTLVFLVLVRPPRDLTSQLNWRPWAITAAVVLRWLLLIAVLAIIGSATRVTAEYPWRAIPSWILITPIALIAATLGVCKVMRRAILSAVSSRKVIFAGYNDASLDIARTLASNSALRLQVEGFFDDRGRRPVAHRARHPPGRPALGAGRLRPRARHRRDLHRPADAPREARARSARRSARHHRVDLLRTGHLRIRPDPGAFRASSTALPVVAMCETPFYGYRGLIKRLIDIGVSGCFLVFGSPLLLLIALLVKLTSPGPVLFLQRRYGLDGQRSRSTSSAP